MSNPNRLISSKSSAAIRFYATAAAAAAPAGADAVGKAEAWETPRRNLSLRLSFLGTCGGTVSMTLSQYIKEGNIILRQELSNCVEELRKHRNYQHALEIFKWMDSKCINLTPEDHAICIDLISRTEGISSAENYFNNLPPYAKNTFTHGSLLNHFCRKSMVDNALSLFEKMDKLGYANLRAFNNLMSLYMRLGQPQKVPPLVEKMKAKKMYLSAFTCKYWMNSCVCMNDIDGVENIMREIERKNGKDIYWANYSTLAAIYVKARFFAKAELALRKLEEMKPRDRMAYHFLIGLYGETSNLEAVYRVWNYLKLNFMTKNMSYLIMLQALAKLKDVHGVKECFDEWESRFFKLDKRLVNDTIKTYLRWNMVEDAKQLLISATKRSRGPLTRVWEMFLGFILKRQEEDLEAYISEANLHKWEPDPDVMISFFGCFKKNKDVEGAEEICRLLKMVNCLDSNFYKSLIKIYIAAGRVAPGMRSRMAGDGIEITSDFENLLEIVCPKQNVEC